MDPIFSNDLTVEILLRLPVKSLLRFKCVCKAWLSLISDPHFAKSHFDLAASPTNRILLKSVYGSFIQSIDTDSSLYNDSAVLKLHIPLPSNPLQVSKFRFLGCCRGFIVYAYDDGDLILWNPSTNFHKYIPHPYINYMFKIFHGFGYDESTDDYLIIFVPLETNNYKDHESSIQSWVTRLEIFSLKTKSWNKIKLGGINFPNINYGFSCLSTGLFYNGALHWLLSSINTHTDVIVAYDLKERRLSEIPMPRDLTMEVKSAILGLKLTIMNGCFSLCCNSQSNEMVEIWMMKEYRVESSWTKSIVLSSSHIRGNFFLPMCFTKGGEIIGSINHKGLAKFNDKGDLLECQIYDQGFRLESAVYRESLLSFPTN